MKVVARFCNQWGNFSTKTIEFSDGETCLTFRAKIAQKFLLKEEKFILKLMRDGFYVKIFIKNFLKFIFL